MSRTRRKYLQTVGGLAMFSTMGAQTVSAKSNTETYNGIAYDTKTHNVVGIARANLKNEDGLRGTIKAGNRMITIDSQTPTISDESAKKVKNFDRFSGMTTGYKMTR